MLKDVSLLQIKNEVINQKYKEVYILGFKSDFFLLQTNKIRVPTNDNLLRCFYTQDFI